MYSISLPPPHASPPQHLSFLTLLISFYFSCSTIMYFISPSLFSYSFLTCHYLDLKSPYISPRPFCCISGPCPDPPAEISLCASCLISGP
ncbi:hypothetical protein FKM82_012349 [Ascaphus truei]